MSKELPFFKFFPSEWMLGRISHEGANEQVAFLKTCCMYWHKGCVLSINDLHRYLTKDRIKSLIDNGYIEILGDFNLKESLISIKFLDEQLEELGGARQKRVLAGRLGGLKTQAKIKQRLTEEKKVLNHLDTDKKKKREDYIYEAMNNPNPNERLTKVIAEKIIDSKIKKGEIKV